MTANPYAPAIETEARPTGVRYLVIAVTTLTAVLLYLDRYFLSFAEGFIKEDLRLTSGTDWFYFAFFFSYALGQVPSGWLSDRFGARTTLTLYVLLWSGFTALCGLTFGFWAFFGVQLGFGLSQAGAYPTAAGLLSKWAPLSMRGTASSIVSLGGRAGAVLAPLLTAWLIVSFAPAEQGSDFADDDLLLPARWCAKVTQPAPTDPAAKGYAKERDQAGVAALLRERLYVETRTDIERAGQEYREKADLAPGLSADSMSRLMRDLNGLLSGEPLYEPSEFPTFSVEREARSIVAIDPSLRTLPQTQRLNRLLLEAAFPGEFRRVYSRGWRNVTFLYGGLGLVVALLFWVVFRNTPAEHPRCNAAEVELIRGAPAPPPPDPAPTAKSPDGEHNPYQTPAAGGKAREGLPVTFMLTSGSLWLICISQFTTNLGWQFVTTRLPRYLDEVHHVPTLERGQLLMIPVFVGCFGMLAGGRLTDLLSKRIGVRWGRALPLGLTRFGAMFAYLGMTFLGVSPLGAVALMAAMAFCTDLGTPSVWAYKQDVGGKYVASILGWGNMWGNLGSALFTPIFDACIRGWSWEGAFLFCALAFAISGTTALGVDATRPIVPVKEG